jgi:REP element-mobilizing transposase RayT
MSEFIHKKHNVSVLLYHIVCPAKYRKAVFTPDVDEKLKEICEEISLRYEIEFLEIGTDSDHVHFLVQSVPTYSPTKIVRTIKSITAKEIFKQIPELKKQGSMVVKHIITDTFSAKSKQCDRDFSYDD